MKFIHTADWHIGKKVCEYSMLEDQKYILDQIIEIVKEEKPDGVIIAGDVYDKSVPSAEAVSMLDEYLFRLSKLGTKVFVLSGNHDSPQRIAFGGRLMEDQGCFMSPVYSGDFTPVTLRDEFGEVDVWMLPFVRPADVRRFLSEEEACQVEDYTSAVAKSISKMKFTEGRRNVLVAHQFVTGAECSDSEENVGGLDNVDAKVFETFDYVALGHIHKPQGFGVKVRYSGTPLKYSLSEANHKKSVTVVELKDCSTDIRTIELKPLRDMRKIRGTFDELVSMEFCQKQLNEGKSLEDFVYAELTDEDDIPEAIIKLRGVYKNIMTLDYDNSRTRNQNTEFIAINVEKKSPMSLFADFYERENGRPLEGEPLEFMENLIREIWEG